MRHDMPIWAKLSLYTLFAWELLMAHTGWWANTTTTTSHMFKLQDLHQRTSKNTEKLKKT